MDEIEDFFNISKEFKRECAPVPKPIIEQPKASTSKSLKRECDYLERKESKLSKLEIQSECRLSHRCTARSNPRNLPEDFLEDDHDEDEYYGVGKERSAYLNVDDGVYDRYAFNLGRDSSLPIHHSKEEIIEGIRKNPVVLLEGDTGCGKTTQVPQYILDDAYKRKEYCKIVVTQPRRIAAISLSKRVCVERQWEEGTVVGYQVGLHANMSNDTRLLYCTTGVLLQKLIKEKSLTHYTHIILDEVHERDHDMDFLMIIVRRLLITNSKHVKIILMSATMDTTEFADYFKIRNKPAKIIKVDTYRLYQVKEYYLDDLNLLNANHAHFNPTEPGISTEMYALVLKIIVLIDSYENQDSSLVSHASDNREKSSVLIFLPGISEIDQMAKKIEQLCLAKNSKVELCCIRLHSIISPNEQVKVFHRPPPGVRKVILATNIAESSITVPDVKCVIDFCLIKLQVTDSSTNFTTLQLNWASKVNCRQRAGRAGRVMHGVVYRLVSRTFYEEIMDDFSRPEMTRCPLDVIVLKAKMLDMGTPPEVLSLALSPPNLNHIQNTILSLKELGGLYKTSNGVYTIDDGDLTYVGRIMAYLPVDIRLSRLIVFGYVFSALEDAIIMAAGLSVRSIFSFNSWKEFEEQKSFLQKLEWADGTGSDLIAILRAYKKWLTLSENEETESLWAEQYMINLRSMQEMHLLVNDIKGRLASFNIKQKNIHETPQWLTWEKAIILKIIIAGAFYPNYFIYSKLHDPEKERSNFHTVCGRDLCRTVYFTSFDRRHIGQLYARSIKELFKSADIDPQTIEVSFQSNSERVLVTFKDDYSDKGYENQPSSSDSSEKSYKKYRFIKTPGSVCIDVYKAIRMRFLDTPNTINVMDSRTGVDYAEDHGLGAMHEGTWVPAKCKVKNAELVVLPSVSQKYISGTISHIESCSKFYVQPTYEQQRINDIKAMLNNPLDIEFCKFRNPNSVATDMIVAAPFEGKYYRGKILKIVHQSRHGAMYEILFMDYGNKAIIRYEDLRYFPSTCKYLTEFPPRLLVCRLAMVEPSALKSPSSQWTDEAMVYLQEHADSGVAEIEVFSVVDGVCNVMIRKDCSTINNILVEKGLARSSDESFMSKSDHDVRIRKQSVPGRIDDSCQNEEYFRSIYPEVDLEIDPPPSHLCTKKIHLRGPYSPLESTLFSAVRSGNWKSVHIKKESVNFMNIDSDPKDMYERLVVAADITESQKGRIFAANSTTQMPNIHGFGALMTMMFCPIMQIKRNKNRTKYGTILAGLGYDEQSYKPLYEEHDLVLNLDVDILQNDIELVNEIRLSMDSLLYTEPEQTNPIINPNDIEDLTLKIKNLVLRLLNKQRKYIEMNVNPNDTQWEEIDTNDVVETPDLHGYRSLFPPIKILRLYEEKYEHIHALNVHCHELHDLRLFEGSIQPTSCRLCDQPLESVVQLRIHLLSQLHRDREHQIGFKATSSN